MIILKSKSDIEHMRKAGHIVAVTLQELRQAVRPGVSTGQLDALAESVIRKHGATPSFKGYPNARKEGPRFPGSICASINDELVHGIPSQTRLLKEGDIIAVDVGAIYKHWHGDSAWTFPVGQVSDQAKRLLETTERSLYAGLAKARAGRRLNDVAAAVQKTVESEGFSVVREYTGHGIGRNMHEEPQILHYVHPTAGRLVLRLGMTLALEPMVNAGGWETRLLPDAWTVVTADGSLAAHFEHTFVVTEGEPDILTTL